MESSNSVLLVDDELDLLTDLAEFLGSEGFEVAQATDGIDALSYLYASRPRVALIDLVMPRMNGIELIEQIRSDPSLASVRVVTMSGTVLMLSRARLAGANDVVRKPIDPTALVRSLKRQSGHAHPG
ncbi:MAG TPA: response regulator [Polyangiaceae bacterium]